MITTIVLGLISLLASLQIGSLFAAVEYALPFLILLMIGLCIPSSRKHMTPCAIGAFVPIAAFHLWFLIDSFSGAFGANIGLGLVGVFVLPIVIPTFMFFGWICGSIQQQYSSRTTANNLEQENQS